MPPSPQVTPSCAQIDPPSPELPLPPELPPPMLPPVEVPPELAPVDEDEPCPVPAPMLAEPQPAAKIIAAERPNQKRGARIHSSKPLARAGSSGASAIRAGGPRYHSTGRASELVEDPASASPSPPKVSLPQHQTVPSVRTAQLWR